MPSWFARFGVSPSLLRNAHDMHGAIWRLYPAYEEGRPRLLYRVEDWDVRKLRDERRRVPVLVLAPDPPNPDGHDGIELYGSKPFTPTLKEGSVLAFALVAHPTRTVRAEPDDPSRPKSEWTRGRRVWITSESERRAWLARQLEPAAELVEARVLEERRVRFAKPSAASLYAACKLYGLLRVTDAAALVALIERGIGSGKAYGCGLLTLARPD